MSGLKIENVEVQKKFWMETEDINGKIEYCDQFGDYVNVNELLNKTVPFAHKIRIIHGNDHEYRIMYEYDRRTGIWHHINQSTEEYEKNNLH